MTHGPARRFNVTALLVGLCSFGVLAQRPSAGNPSFGPLIVHRLSDSVYWTQGGVDGNNCNTGFVIGDRGVVVIDAKLNAESAKQMLEAITALTPKPVTHVILTHSDNDHVSGLPAFPPDVVVIAHENAKRELAAALERGGRGAPPPKAIPTQVVGGSRESLSLDEIQVVLLHGTPAHTSGDLAVWLPDRRILFTGDLMATTRPEPVVHLEKGGSSAGFVERLRELSVLGAEQIVPGHGTLVTAADLQRRADETDATRRQVRSMVEQGKSLAELGMALGVPVDGPGLPSLAEVVYRELTR